MTFLLLLVALASQGPPRQADAPPVAVSWTAALGQKSEWYATSEARAIADNVLPYQSVHGAWPKNTDLTKPLTPEITAAIEQTGEANTIDNGATTTPMRFLALVNAAKDDARYREAFQRGLDYLLASQYANGGWPQFFPLREGYYSHITYNDDAMVNVMTMLRDVGAGMPIYAFVDQSRKTKAVAAVARGIDVILRTQVKQGGKLTAWCAQHDEKTLEPAWARRFEPPSLSGSETVGIARFLMGIEKSSPAIVAAIEAAVAWSRASAISGIRYEDFTGEDGKKDRRVVADPGAKPIWARFYDLSSNRPIFMGRDSVVRYAVSEIEYERRNGYAYYGIWPESLLSRDYPRWREKQDAAVGKPGR